MNYLFILTVFLAAVLASNPFDAFAPKNAKALEEYNKTVVAVAAKHDAIVACATANKDAAAFKTCISKLGLPQQFVDNFPTEKFTDVKAIEKAMTAYSAALTKEHDKTPSTPADANTDKNKGDVHLAKSKDAENPIVNAIWFAVYFAVVAAFVVGFVLIVYVYFVNKKESSDL